MSPPWRTCSTSMASPPIHASGDLLRREPDPADRRSAGADSADPAGWSASTSSTSATAPSISSSSSTSIAPGARSRSPSDVPPPTSPNACASSATSISRSRKDPGRHGQPLDPQPGLPLQRPCPHPSRRILRRLEFHFTPKHASWLNMVEIEIGVLRGNASTAGSPVATSSKPRSPPGSDSATTARAHQMDVHDGESQTQTESRLPEAPSTDRRSAQRVITSVSNH